MTANSDPGATRAAGHRAADADIGPVGDRDALRGTTAPTNARADRIRWGAVWTGALTTLSIYLALQLLFFALGWLDLGLDGEGGGGTTRAVVSGILGLVAFFLGGMAAGASALWGRSNDGMVNGVVSWAVTVISVLALALIGGGALLGSLAEVATQFADASGAATNVDVAAATQAARETAGWAALGLGLTAVASGVGGSVGARLWPSTNRHDAQDVRDVRH